jgi:hypothetical protein
MSAKKSRPNKRFVHKIKFKMRNFRDEQAIKLMNQATIDIEDPSVEDFGEMYQLISEFVNETGSVVGKEIVDNWEEKCIKFVKIFPKDYKSALAELEAEKQAAEAKKEAQQSSNHLMVISCFFTWVQVEIDS